MDSINAEYPVIFVHKLKKKISFFSFMVNLHAKPQLQIFPYLVSQLYICLTDPNFKHNGYYVQNLHICVGASQTRMVNLNLSCTAGTAVSLFRSCLGSDALISQLLWVGADTPSHLAHSRWPMPYWQGWKEDWALAARWDHWVVLFPLQNALRNEPEARLPLQSRSEPSFSLTSSAFLTCSRCLPRPLLQYNTCTRIHFSDLLVMKLSKIIWYPYWKKKNQWLEMSHL